MIRNSSIELLRIVSMLMVLMVHTDGASLGLPTVYGHIDSMTVRDVWRLAVEALTIIGVNCFTLVSGYFGIRLRVTKIASFLFQCLFYSVGLATVAAIAFPERFGTGYWLESWLVLTHTDLWYVPAYFILMLVSPVLNRIMTKAGRRGSAWLLMAVSALMMFGGWWMQWSFNPSGYTAWQLIWIYCTGRYIGLYAQIDRIDTYTVAALYIASVIGIYITSLYMPVWLAFAYNSPFVVLSSVTFFLFFARLRFESKAVNYIARSSFAAYLIHKNPLVWGNVMKPLVVRLWALLPLWAFTLAALAVVAAFYLLAMAADPIRRRTWAFINSYLSPYIIWKRT